MIAIDVQLLERIALQRRFESRTLDIAKRLFIHRETPKRVASEFGVNLQRVYAIRKEILAAARDAALPDGWVEVTLVGPQDLIAQVKASFERAMAQRVGREAEERSLS
jgi:hypothetical protein